MENSRRMLMLIHEFVIVSEVPNDIDYNNYSKEEMVLVSDNFIQQYYEITRKIEFYDNNLNCKEYGLNYHGITILDIEMAKKLKDALLAFCKPCEDLTKVIDILARAISVQKYIIHFGI
jgi:hypothetical protein